MTPAIEIRQVHKRFGSLHALRGVDLSVEQGEFFALLGPNGAGKTTLINILAGLARVTQGSCAVLGYDVVTDYRNARRVLGVVPQELVYDAFFTVREMLRFQSGYFGLKHNDAWIDELLHNLGLTDKADIYTRLLSGGMKRRVLVAQALVHKPPVIVLDEPTAGVDVELRQNLWEFIRRLNRDGHTIVLTTHYLEEAEALCNRVAMLKQGQIIALDTTQNLLSAHAATQVRLRLNPSRLPDALQPLLAGEEAGWFRLVLSDCAALEGVLATLREANVAVADIEVSKPDLEEVFLQIMGKAA
ncbi:MAG: ABC transporter ATP-binding protein [Betaproteobacteria bacterium]|nr:ABC transporter ATP-binding protein [Betaproteobacteria bacterium]